MIHPDCWKMTTEPPRRYPQESAIVETVAHLSMELIERYALRELSADDFQRAERHVAKCPTCEDRLQEQVDSWAAMRSSTVAMVRKFARAKRKRMAG